MYLIHPKIVLHRQEQWLRWEKPTLLFKLNADGLEKEGLCTDGGVIREYNGHFIAAFSAAHGQGSNMQAEIFSLSDDLKFCNSVLLSNVEVESDSKVAVQAHQVFIKFLCSFLKLLDNAD